MGRMVGPKVFLVGFTTASAEGVREYLAHTGQEEFLDEWDEALASGVSPGEALCSLYAKLCYKSLVAGKNANVTRVRSIQSNIENCHRVAHGAVFEHCYLNFIVTDCSRVYCYTDDAEVYTKGGWKSITALAAGEEILTLNPETRRCRFSEILSTHSFDYAGDVVSLQSSQYSTPGVTPDHVMWAARYDLRRARGLSNREIVDQFAEKVPMADLRGRRFVIEHGIKMESYHDPETVVIGGHTYDAFELLEWLGWVATDGTFESQGRNGVVIYQSKLENVTDIRRLMSSLFGQRFREHGPYTNADVIKFVVSDSALARWAREAVGPDKRSRKFSDWIMGLSPRLLRAFYGSALRGDGSVHRKSGHEVLYCPSKVAADQWQIILAQLGKAANIRVDNRVGELHEVGENVARNNYPIYVISVSRKSATMVDASRQLVRRYEGKVYCPRTADGLIFVRKSGLPFWCGNTHEQVRHRPGWAYSQTSGRYCRLDAIDVVWDPILEPVRDLAEEHMAATERFIYLAECRLGLRRPNDEHPDAHYDDCLRDRGAPAAGSEALRWVPNDGLDFDRKKKLTSALRRFAPNGQSNELGMTANIRALRHVVQLRTARAAEWEIRSVYGQLYNLVKARFPTIFYGAREEVYDGLLEIRGMKTLPYEITADDPSALAIYSVEQLQAEIASRAANGGGPAL